MRLPDSGERVADNACQKRLMGTDGNRRFRNPRLGDKEERKESRTQFMSKWVRKVQGLNCVGGNGIGKGEIYGRLTKKLRKWAGVRVPRDAR